MKKSLIALAVAGAMTAPMIAQADATLYGLVETRLQDFDDADLDLSATKIELGVIGTADNDIEGLETGFQIEWRFNSGNAGAEDEDAANSTVTFRKANVWLEGAYGRGQFGMQNNPAERGVWSISNRNNAIFLAQSDRINNAAVYISPNMNGLELSAGIGMDGGRGEDASTGEDGDDVDLTVLGASYRAMGLGLGLGYMSAESTSDSDAADDGFDNLSLQANYKIDALTLGASYFDHDSDAANADYDAWLVGASYALGKASVYAEYTDKDADTDAADNDMVAVGARYALGSKAMVQVEYADYDENIGGATDNLIVEYQVNF